MSSKTLIKIQTARPCCCKIGNGLRQCSRTAQFRTGNLYFCLQHAVAKFGVDAVTAAA